ncbi:bifunctional phosphoserine phosphatase/homoserine phosphotransferase ThrH [Pseudomonas capeferrum]|uniref:bifunctional phosphoserine phosphatase/homoserine phosphotransferase ThrH n=1 Tax=Pseudomonas capeferrum TaxID=1495066 RepID=UPI0015E37E3D|nr:bifunctional phosphoserine phosphatase/homoserine phosphotransferase ThrH [Pseudomonas capeferrum]MBA1204453.1 bifunctional phosphoserine phosphatase/homoserine phosphotransferase ThrH [Pseudomonas capeferrum]
MGALSKLACIDLEGVLVPELWPAIAVRTGIRELFATTREIPDYDALMRQRIALLREHGITLSDVQRILATVEPFAGAVAFLQALEARGYRVNIISDCFHELADPLLQALGEPTTWCHRLTADSHGFVSGCDYYPRRGKEEPVDKALAEGQRVLAVGDAFNDINMLRRATQGFLVNPSISTLDAAPDLRAVESLEEILELI